MLLYVRLWERTPPKHQRPFENASLEVVNKHVTAAREAEEKLQCSALPQNTNSSQGGVWSPHVLVVDDFNNRTGHLPAVHIDPLQQRLQPAHITLNVRVEEGEHLACNTGRVVLRELFNCVICDVSLPYQHYLQV